MLGEDIRATEIGHDALTHAATVTIIEDLVADDEHWPRSGLLAAANRPLTSPIDLASQYAGHDSDPAVNPSSATARSSVASSLAASSIRRLWRCRPISSRLVNWASSPPKNRQRSGWGLIF